MAETTSAMLPRFLDKRAFALLRARLRLSRREGRIVECIFRDDEESAIACRLDISPHTLRTHVERLYQKLEVTSRMELAIRLHESFLAPVCEPRSPLPPLLQPVRGWPLSAPELTAQEATGGAACGRVKLLWGGSLWCVRPAAHWHGAEESLRVLAPRHDDQRGASRKGGDGRCCPSHCKC